MMEFLWWEERKITVFPLREPTERLFVREQMKNKKILAIVAVVVVLVLLGVMIFFGGNKNSETDADESDITKIFHMYRPLQTGGC